MILKKLSSRFSQTKITAVTIDEGLVGYREEAVDLASEYCKKLGVDHEIVSFEELYGSGLDDFLRQRQDRLTACSYCAVFWRNAINVAARRLAATKIATSHNLDDVV